MPQKLLHVALEIKREALDSQTLEALEALSQVMVTMCHDLTQISTFEQQEIRPDILIIDDRVEEVDTVSRLRELKEMFAGAEIFVVSSDKRPQHIVDLMKAGASEYLASPLNVIELIDAIEEIRVKKGNAGQVTQGTTYSFIGKNEWGVATDRGHVAIMGSGVQLARKFLCMHRANGARDRDQDMRGRANLVEVVLRAGNVDPLARSGDIGLHLAQQISHRRTLIAICASYKA